MQEALICGAPPGPPLDEMCAEAVAAGAMFGVAYSKAFVSIRLHTSAYVNIRQHTSAHVSIRLHTSAYVCIRLHTSAYVSIRQHTSAYVEHLRSLKPERRTLKQRRPPPLPASVAFQFGAVRRLTAPRLETEGILGGG